MELSLKRGLWMIMAWTNICSNSDALLWMENGNGWKVRKERMGAIEGA